MRDRSQAILLSYNDGTVYKSECSLKIRWIRDSRKVICRVTYPNTLQYDKIEPIFLPQSIVYILYI
jgi:hypothetical protein